MKYIAIKGFNDEPQEQFIEFPELGISFDYSFEGYSMGVERIADLYISTIITDHIGNRFTRRSQQLVPRREVKNCITFRIKEHLLHVGLSPSEVRMEMRDFEVDVKKGKAIER